MDVTENRKIRRFRTRGGAVVTWTYDPKDTYGSGGWGSLECGGCGGADSRVRPSDGNHHASVCFEIAPPTTSGKGN